MSQVEPANWETQYGYVTRVEEEQPFIEVTREGDELPSFIPVPPPFAQYCQVLYGDFGHMYPAHLLLIATTKFSRKDAFVSESKWTKRLYEVMQLSLNSDEFSYPDSCLVPLISMIGVVTEYPDPDGNAMESIPKIGTFFKGYIERIEPEYSTKGLRGHRRYMAPSRMLFSWLLEETAEAFNGVGEEAMEKNRENPRIEEEEEDNEEIQSGWNFPTDLYM
ncbi:hypothetical protein PENSTE_c023G03898 [Penicillium steckii]|uniref:Uncharacterized protein n=1 Tax=Penicillium steckii TaxID=303698 RepID=A0A1V6SS95_9EURO|nr:hypothetical protein PENSTE_c023G03898 [Penicillium steckii]